MLKTQPTTNALLVNNLIHGRPPVDAVSAFRHIERAYNVTIKLTHTGIKVQSRHGMGRIYYEKGDVSAATGTHAAGKNECDAQRTYAFNFLVWAANNMPCAEVSNFVRNVSGGLQ